MTERKNPFVRLIRFIWFGLDSFRKFVHLLLMLVIFALLLAGLAGETVRVPESAAIVVAPTGVLVEQLKGNPVERALAELQGNGVRQTLVRDVTDSLAAAADDDRIKAVILSLDKLEGGGLAKLQTIADALAKLRESGKPVLAIGDSFTRDQYYLAAQADEIYMHDFGVVFIDGYAYFRTYLKSALDKLDIDLNVFRVGEYKSFVEPFTRNDMSPADREASERWLKSLWGSYQSDVTVARELQPDALDSYANDFAARLEAADGNTAQLAVDAGLVNELVTRQQFNDRLIDLVGESAEKPGRFASIDFRAYLRSVRAIEALTPQADNIGVLVAAGQIVDGEAPPGTVGGDTLAGLVRQAAQDDSIKAVVLQIDSQGGSMFASEVVFDQLESLKAAGKPLVVSMSSVAASGGYYIAMLADEVWARESTITGSIGVGALVPTFQRGLNRLGVNVDGLGTTDLAGQLRPDRELGPDAREVLQASVDEAYRIFVGKVAATRGMSYERAESVARGRVWVGSDALELGLVDRLGGIDAAIASAAAKAGLEPGAFGLRYVEKELSLQERIAREFSVRASRLLHHIGVGVGSPGLVARLAGSADRQLAQLARLNDPRSLYYHCFCDLR